MDRKTGILLPIASLPNQYGIGDFGKEAYQFIDHLKEAKIKIWQILPLNSLGYGNSPYQPFSSKAGEPLYISLDLLFEEGLINEPKKINKKKGFIDYEETKQYKAPYLKEAYEQFKTNETLNEEYIEFIKNHSWVYYYGIFYTLKYLNGMVCWLNWKEEHKIWINNPTPLEEYQDLIKETMFYQFLFFKQWFKLKDYANHQNIEILGDIPFYVGIDSLDVWMNQESFLLDSNKNPTYIAGVPPDYFSPTGQRWGNPIYNWEYLKENNFEFWIDRIKSVDKMYDFIRIDHFRAFDTYWKIPSSCPTAIEGEWVEAPGYALFEALFNELGSINLIAEDLGDLRDEVYTLRDTYKLPGMQVIQFHLNPFSNNDLIEKNEATILYTGTHDNQTLFSWYLELAFNERKAIWNYLSNHGYREKTIDLKFLHYCLDSKANIVIFPIQDLLCLKDEARLNTPGTLGSPNWEFRLSNFDAFIDKIEIIKNFIIDTKRD